MHIISDSQHRAFLEVIHAASDMLDLMNEAPPDVWDSEWRYAVRESLDRVGYIVRNHHIYISKKED